MLLKSETRIYGQKNGKKRIHEYIIDVKCQYEIYEQKEIMGWYTGI
jgi:hypothetical protein